MFQQAQGWKGSAGRVNSLLLHRIPPGHRPGSRPHWWPLVCVCASRDPHAGPRNQQPSDGDGGCETYALKIFPCESPISGRRRGFDSRLRLNSPCGVRFHDVGSYKQCIASPFFPIDKGGGGDWASEGPRNVRFALAMGLGRPSVKLDKCGEGGEAGEDEEGGEGGEGAEGQTRLGKGLG